MKTSISTSPPLKKPRSYRPAHADIPADGQPLPLAAGIRWLRTPLPFALDHLNIWLLEQEDGPRTIIDCGYDSIEVRNLWQPILADGQATDNILVTHFHPDHIGLCGHLRHRTGAAVLSTAPEYDLARHLCDKDYIAAAKDDYMAHYLRSGCSPAMAAQLTGRLGNYKNGVKDLPPDYQAITPGQELALAGRTWRVIDGYGHSPQHACLYDAANNVFISGDIVLPDISPNISLYPRARNGANPVGDYLDSLTRIEELVPADALVLPSHGVPFYGLHIRIAEMRQHHQRRLDRICALVADAPAPLTAWEAMRSLFAHRQLEEGEYAFALGETLAHLHHLVVTDKMVQGSKDGIALYSLNA